MKTLSQYTEADFMKLDVIRNRSLMKRTVCYRRILKAFYKLLKHV
jgi:hypothetical protein